MSEDPNVTVGVLEAGTYHYNEPLVDVPGTVLKLDDDILLLQLFRILISMTSLGYFGRAIGNPNFDWAYVLLVGIKPLDRKSLTPDVYMHRYLTVPQKHVNGRPIYHPRYVYRFFESNNRDCQNVGDSYERV